MLIRFSCLMVLFSFLIYLLIFCQFYQLLRITDISNYNFGFFYFSFQFFQFLFHEVLLSGAYAFWEEDRELPRCRGERLVRFQKGPVCSEHDAGAQRWSGGAGLREAERCQLLELSAMGRRGFIQVWMHSAPLKQPICNCIRSFWWLEQKWAGGRGGPFSEKQNDRPSCRNVLSRQGIKPCSQHVYMTQKETRPRMGTGWEQSIQGNALPKEV